MGFGMNIEKISVEKLLPAKYNPRKDLQPGDPEFEKLKRSITEFGYVEPIIWNKRTGVVIGGHQRLKVLQHLGYTEGAQKASVIARKTLRKVYKKVGLVEKPF